MPLITLTTKAASKLYRSPDKRPSDKLESYFSPAQEIEIACTTQEREDFETENEIALTADVIEDKRDFEALVRYLTANCKLKL